jgi:hypothetical protein
MGLPSRERNFAIHYLTRRHTPPHAVLKNGTIFTTRFCLGSSTLQFCPSIVFFQDLGMLQLLEIF